MASVAAAASSSSSSSSSSSAAAAAPPAPGGPHPSNAALAISPHLCPIIHTFSSPELSPILARSKLSSISHLLSAFEARIDKVTIRSTNYEARLLPRFGVKFVERALPPARAHSSSISSAATPRSAPSSSTLPPVPTTPATPFIWPTQAERDELFLDSLASLIASRVDSWLAQPGREELDVRPPIRPKARLPSEEEIAQDSEVAKEQQDHDEGWEGRTIDSLTPWYAAMRDQVLKRREMTEIETFNWPVACLLALSTSHPDPLNALSSLWDLTSKESLFSPSSYPPRSGAEEDGRHEWANPDILRYIVLVHDFGAGGGRDGWEDAQQLHETIRKTYGHHTALLPIFSASPTASKPQPRARGIATLWDDPFSSLPPLPAHSQAAAVVGLGVDAEGDDSQHPYGAVDHQVEDLPRDAAGDPIERGHELSDEDLKSLRVFLREMVVQSIIPWIERSVVVGYEQYQASKKSIGGRLFSAGRKYFGGSAGSSRSGSPVSATGQPMGYNAAKGYYPYISQESQTRRLADLAFILGDYKLSSTLYESLSKDHKTDRAYRHYASSCRMAGLSLLLSYPSNQPLPANPDTWLEMALQTPATVVGGEGGTDFDALKAMLFYYESYLSIADLRPAPAGLVRTAGESDELTSAILLEQAALSDLRLPGPGGRGKKRKFGFHMILAAKRYEKSGVKSLSRRCLSQARGVFGGVELEPWTKEDPRYEALSSSEMSWQGVANEVERSLARQAYNAGRSNEAISHFLNLMNNDEEDGEWLDDFALAWERLSEEEKQAGKWEVPRRIWKGARVWTNKGGEGEGEDWEELKKSMGVKPRGGEGKNEIGVGETFYLELLATNPLNASLAIGGLSISTSSSDSSSISISAPQGIELAPRESQRIYVPVIAHSLGSFSFTYLSYRFSDLLPCVEELKGRKKRLNLTQEQQTSIMYAEDRSMLTVNVRSPVPSLSIELESLPDSIYAGEVRSTVVRLTNVGQVGLVALQAICNAPSFSNFKEEGKEMYLTNPDGSIGTTVTTVGNRLESNQPTVIPLGEGQELGPGASIEVPLMLRGDAVGVHDLKWLFAYKSQDSSEILSTCAAHHLDVLPSLEIRPLVRPSASASVPYVLACSIHNQNIPGDLIITQIASLSPKWAASMLPDVAFDDHFGPVGWQQSMNVVLAVQPVVNGLDNPGEDGHAFTVRQLDLLLQGKDVSSGSPGDVTLHQASITSSSFPSAINVSSPPLLSSLLRTHTMLRHASLSAQFSTIDRALHSSLFPLFNPRSLDLIVFWSSPSLNIQGHHHLADIPFGAGSNMLKIVLETAEQKAGGLYAESQRERSLLLAALRRSEVGVEEVPVGVLVQVDEALEHEFDQGPHIVPISFHIRNLSPSQSFEYTLVLAPSDSASTTSVIYSGSLTHRGLVSTLGLSTITTQLWVMRQGVYDVGGWKVSVTTSNGDVWTLVGPKKEVRVRDQKSVRPPPVTRRTTSRIGLIDVGA